LPGVFFQYTLPGDAFQQRLKITVFWWKTADVLHMEKE
jgi:hypothetical protein